MHGFEVIIAIIAIMEIITIIAGMEITDDMDDKFDFVCVSLALTILYTTGLFVNVVSSAKGGACRR